jgi:hypothetical protein
MILSNFFCTDAHSLIKWLAIYVFFRIRNKEALVNCGVAKISEEYPPTSTMPCYQVVVLDPDDRIVLGFFGLAS